MEYTRLQILGLLKGCPLSVMVALKLARQMGHDTVGATWLALATGYSDKPVAKALALLESYGQVERKARYAWALAEDASMLCLFDGWDEVRRETEDNVETIALCTPVEEELEDHPAGESDGDTGSEEAHADKFSQRGNISESENFPFGEFFSLSEKFFPSRRKIFSERDNFSDSEKIPLASSSRYLESRSRLRDQPLARVTDPENFRHRAISAALKPGRAPPWLR